ncbi:PspC domain-containing protein [Auraticoccus sp. F435]|uniref:PspC domain-containing protein n=1 Tax=Auraticoccus cholistanensis TaxID=2656650 RepID=A0A6A9UXJ4_9ACTN|nr:PspC domain-containing protein [Auraticoccus cholistanensis]MVA76372.1 PspC domain-containing protein [Auraticoccus cholistanensis]
MTTTQPRQLHRSRDQRIVAGVCGGVADYLNMDPTLVRVVFVALTLVTGGAVGLIAYLVGALVVPEEPLADPGQLTSPGSPWTAPATHQDAPAASAEEPGDLR